MEVTQEVTQEVTRLRQMIRQQGFGATVKYRCHSEADADRIEAHLTPEERNHVVFSWGTPKRSGLFGWLQAGRRAA
ncbi:MAG TPA: hypothetical protein VFU47_11960 [Armatimonadota bacterium]|nr:hypothetical protein [Armatimonadota bacterium]